MRSLVMLNRRQILFGFGAIAAPYVIRNSGILMPVRQLFTSSNKLLFTLEASNDLVTWAPIVRALSAKEILLKANDYEFQSHYINHRDIVDRDYIPDRYMRQNVTPDRIARRFGVAA